MRKEKYQLQLHQYRALGGGGGEAGSIGVGSGSCRAAAALIFRFVHIACCTKNVASPPVLYPSSLPAGLRACSTAGAAWLRLCRAELPLRYCDGGCRRKAATLSQLWLLCLKRLDIFWPPVIESTGFPL